jgi:ketosteroid isomerase-like protein
MNSPTNFETMKAVEGTDREIMDAESRIRAAQLNADLHELDALIADEILFTGPTGELGTKAQDIEAYRSGAVKFLEHEPLDLRVRKIGANAAVSALLARLAVEAGGVVVRGTYRYTRVWAREEGSAWKVVGGHVSEVPPIL